MCRVRTTECVFTFMGVEVRLVPLALEVFDVLQEEYWLLKLNSQSTLC